VFLVGVPYSDHGKVATFASDLEKEKKSWHFDHRELKVFFQENLTFYQKEWTTFAKRNVKLLSKEILYKKNNKIVLEENF
jgi:hypothetical protein